MDDLRLQAVAARVVAWHNRHPLARRISAQQVRSVGYVGLSIGDGAGTDAESAESAGSAASLAGAAARAGSAAAALAGAGLSVTEHTLPIASAVPQEEDFEAAFAALAEHQAEGATAAAPAAPTAAAPDAGTTPDAALPAPADPLPGAAPAENNADAFEIELDVTADGAEPGAEPSAEPAAEPDADPDADPDATSPPGRPDASGPDPATSALEDQDGDVATLLAPAQPAPAAALAPAAPPAASPPLHIPTLRDRVLVRAQQPGVQGGLLTAHEGYRPTVHPHAQAPAWGQSAAEHGEGDRFMAPLSPREVARWVARHGRALLQAPADGPLRRVSTAAVAGGPAAGTTYVMTAAIAGGGLTSRVLVGAGSPGAVLGTRLWSLPRVAAAVALGASLLVLAAVAAAGWLRPAEKAVAVSVVPAAASAAAAHGAASAASAPEAAASAAADPAAASAAEPAAESAVEAGAAAEASTAGAPVSANAAAAHTAETPAAAPPAQAHAPTAADLAITTVKPVPAYAQKGAVGLPPRGLGLSEEDKAAAREAVAAARAGRPVAPREAGAATPTAEGLLARPAGPGGAGDATATAAPAPPAEAPAGPTFAISTRALRTRAEAEQLQAAITALLRAPGAASRRVELLPEGDDWRVVAWPFIGQPEADRVRALLAGRGMKVEVVRF